VTAAGTPVRFPSSTGPGSWELRLADDEIEIVGASVSALATAFAVDRFRSAVDMGRCSALLAAQETVLLTHCHSDHVAGLVAWLSAHTRRHQGAPTRVVVPSQRREVLLQALELWPDLDGVRRRVQLPEVLVGARPGETVELAGGGWASSFEVHHSTPSLGWAVGATDAERPLVVFAGDGTVEPFQDNPTLLDARLAVVDCSFLEPGTRVAARLGGHGHLSDWLELRPRLQCDMLVLGHLPPEATAAQLLEALDGLDHGGPTVVPWIPGPHENRGAHASYKE